MLGGLGDDYMASGILQLSLCVITVIIHLTSSQSTYDVIQQHTDVGSCGRSDLALSRLLTAVSQLQKDVAELKSDSPPTECPATFTYNASVNGCYKVVSDKMLEWSVAGLECRALHKDAHLLVIDDADEQSAVAALLTPISGTMPERCRPLPETHPKWQFFWTAGQRVDPTRNSTFIWRVKTTKSWDQTEYAMIYTNWKSPRQPDYGSSPDTNDDSREACMHLWTPSYTWNDWFCNGFACFVCEIDLSK